MIIVIPSYHLFILDISHWIINDHLDCLRYILKKEPNVIHLKNKTKETLLHICCENVKHDALSYLLEIDQSHINDKDESSTIHQCVIMRNMTPLHITIMKKHINCLRVLINYNVDLNISEDFIGMTPLMIAAFYGHITCIELLIDRGCDVHQCNNDGWNALMWALCNGHSNCIKLLLAHQTVVWMGYYYTVAAASAAAAAAAAAEDF